MSEVPLSRHEAAERDDAAASSSASGACTPEHEAAVAPEADGEEGEGNEAPKNSAIELSRRAVPVRSRFGVVQANACHMHAETNYACRHCPNQVLCVGCRRWSRTPTCAASV